MFKSNVPFFDFEISLARQLTFPCRGRHGFCSAAVCGMHLGGIGGAGSFRTQRYTDCSTTSSSQINEYLGAEISQDFFGILFTPTISNILGIYVHPYYFKHFFGIFVHFSIGGKILRFPILTGLKLYQPGIPTQQDGCVGLDQDLKTAAGGGCPERMSQPGSELGSKVIGSMGYNYPNSSPIYK